MSLLAIFLKPYPYDDRSLPKLAISAFWVGLFVFLFLAFFQPFGLREWDAPHKWQALIGYGIVTFVVMILFHVFIKNLLFRFVDEERWTVSKEIGLILLMITCIALGNYIFNIAIGLGDYTSHGLLTTLFVTHLVGIFPTVFSVMFNYQKLYQKYEKEAVYVDGALKKHEEVNEFSILCIKGENEGELLEIKTTDFLYAKAEDNYFSISYLDVDKVNKKLFRGSLRSLESQINHPSIIRCHRSYLVNKEKIIKITGNAQGYLLHLHSSIDSIPVSRPFLNRFK